MGMGSVPVAIDDRRAIARATRCRKSPGNALANGCRPARAGHRSETASHFLRYVPLFTMLVFAPAAHALDAAGDRPVTKLELASDSRFPNAKVALMQGVADATGDRFELPNTDLMQPIAVDVYTRGAAAGAIRLRIGKGDWVNPRRDGSTDASGRVGFRFRTYNGVKLWISAESSTPYQLIVWSGPPIELPPPPMAVPMSAYVQRHPQTAAAVASAATASTGMPTSLVIGGVVALLLIVVLLLIVIALLVFKRRTSAGAGR
jgi:hypothetical protein